MGRIDCWVRERGMEAERPVQARDDGDLTQRVCREKRGIWWNSRCIIKIELIGFADALDVEEDGKRETQSDSQVFGLSI